MKIELVDCQKSLTLKDFEEIEKKLGYILPERLKKFYLQYNGGSAKRKELQTQRQEEMTDADWRKWFRLKNDARKLIEGLSRLKIESAKSKRKLNISDKLNSANEIYPLGYEDWMQEFWEKQ